MNWAVTGINYQKANLSQRQKYALNQDQIQDIYILLKEHHIKQGLIISTCNRTEFFFPIDIHKEALDLIAEEVYKNEIEEIFFRTRIEDEATEYFFRICSGLESQITGDFEILGQVRKACSLAKQNGMITGTWERAINNALSAAKKARTQTGFYSGASSTSYAAIQHLKNANIDLKKAKYLILGAGKIGSHTIDHLLKFVPKENITITNRSLDKALDLSARKNLRVMPFEELKVRAQEFDVIICATNAPNYIIRAEDFTNIQNRQIIDLSVPLNVDPSIRNMEGINLVNVDELSVMVNKNIQKREAEKSSVEDIIEESLQDLRAWFTIKSGMPMLAELKSELEDIKKEALSNVSSENHPKSSEFLDQYADELFNQLSQQWIKKVRNKAVNAN